MKKFKTVKMDYDGIVYDVPIVPNLHQKIAKAVGKNGQFLQMDRLHSTCGTKHCRAGWAVHLAGKQGYDLVEKMNGSSRFNYTLLAANFIYESSTVRTIRYDRFNDSDEKALRSIKAAAKREKARKKK